MSAERCPASGKKVSVAWDDWADAETATCPHCGSVAKWRVRNVDSPPWGRIAPHRTDGTPCR
ncbi:hypothetical protein ACXYTP_25075 [Tsukamurella ocularis]